MNSSANDIFEMPVMENISTINQDLYFEGVKARGRNLKSIVMAIVGIVIAVAGLMMGNALLSVLGMLITLYEWFSSIIVGKRDFGKLLQLYPTGEWEKRVIFYADHIETHSGTGTCTKVTYEDIRREIATKNLYILDFGKIAPATIMCKDGFQTGSFELLKQFILEMRQSAGSAR